MSLLESFKKHIAQTSDAPLGLEIARAEGVWLYDPSGKRYIDAISGVCVTSVGHRHPAVLHAIEEQLACFTHAMVYGELVLKSQVELATRLAGLLPAGLSVSYLVNSGSESVEGAIKLARRYTGRREIISFQNGYHGSTMGALSLSSSLQQRHGFEPLIPDVKHLPFNEVARLQEISQLTSCVIVEPIQGEAGVVEATPEFLAELRQCCADAGALLIFDEVQTGLGRTGKMFAFEHYGVAPDVLVLGKAIANGLPLAAFISSPEIMSCLKNPPLGHITTFGGNPVACAAALAVLDVITEPGFVDHVNAMGELMKTELQHPETKELRGRGLMIAVQLDNEAKLQEVMRRCLESGVLTDWFLYDGSSLRLCPPLVINDRECLGLCAAVLRSID
jgi:acetylornithine/succinyldiaminopimelate/putrescine aminotransferase